MTDKVGQRPNRVNKHASAVYAEVAAKSDTVDFVSYAALGPTKFIYVGGTGHMVVVLDNDDTVLISAIPVGTIIPIEAKRIHSTGTTATLMVAMF